MNRVDTQVELDQNSQFLLTRIENERAGMTRKLKSIADLALQEPTRFIKMTAKEICEDVSTSEPTLIRFCQNFGYAGLSEFRIDLAVALATRSENTLHVEPIHSDRRNVNKKAKEDIADLAFELMKNDRTIIMDNGSTVEQLAKRLVHHDGLTVMTSGLIVAQNAMLSNKHKVILTGGEIRQDALSMCGRLVEMSIREMRFDTAYIGADSIDPISGLSTFLEDEAHQTRAMVFASKRLVVLADKSKFRKPSLHWICDIQNISTLITDAALDDPVLQDIRAQGVDVLSTTSQNKKES